MSPLGHRIFMTYIKENIVIKLQKLYSPPRNPRVGDQVTCTICEKTSLHRLFIARVQNM